MWYTFNDFKVYSCKNNTRGSPPGASSSSSVSKDIVARALEPQELKYEVMDKVALDKINGHAEFALKQLHAVYGTS